MAKLVLLQGTYEQESMRLYEKYKFVLYMPINNRA